LIATGKEIWYKGLPYGADCYRVVINLDVSYHETQLRSLSEPSVAQKEAPDGSDFL